MKDHITCDSIYRKMSRIGRSIDIDYWLFKAELGFPDSSTGKESACNAGDPGLIPGLGGSAGKGVCYPLQYSWASLVAQLVKDPPAMWRPGFDPWVGKIP